MSDGGPTPSAQCTAGNLCAASSPLFTCVRYPPNCWTEVVGLMGRADQAIDAMTPQDSITRFSILFNLNGDLIGLIAIGDSSHFKAGEVVVEVDGMPAGDTATWAHWLKKGGGDCHYLVLDSNTRKPVSRTITRL